MTDDHDSDDYDAGDPAVAVPAGGGIGLHAAAQKLGGAVHGLAGLMEPVRHLAVNMGVLLGVAFGGPALYHQVTQSSFVIKDISVPPAIANRGLTGDVVAQQILDHIAEIHAQAGSREERASLTGGFDFNTKTMPPINSAVGGFNLAAVVTELRSLFGVVETKVTGELYIAGPADAAKGSVTEYGLRLRVPGVGPLFHSEQPSPSVEPLIEAAAQQIMRKYDPVNLGYYYYRKHALKRALEVADDVLATGSGQDVAWGYMMRGIIAHDQRHQAEAVSDLRETVARAPNFAMGHVTLSEMLLDSGDVAAAEAAARRAIELATDNHETHMALARVMIASHRDDDALAAMQKGIDAEPQLAHAHLIKGRLLLLMHHEQDALAAFKTAATLQATTEPLLEGAKVAEDLHRPDEAYVMLREAIRKEPKDSRGWVAFGQALLDRKAVGRASRAFQKAIALDTDPPRSLLEVSQALDARHRGGEADLLFSHASPKLARDPSFLIGWSEHLWAVDKKSEANAKLHEALAQASIKTNELERAGLLLQKHGEHKDAIDVFSRAIATDPSLEQSLQPQIDVSMAALKGSGSKDLAVPNPVPLPRPQAVSPVPASPDAAAPGAPTPAPAAPGMIRPHPGPPAASISPKPAVRLPVPRPQAQAPAKAKIATGATP